MTEEQIIAEITEAIRVAEGHIETINSENFFSRMKHKKHIKYWEGYIDSAIKARQRLQLLFMRKDNPVDSELTPIEQMSLDVRDLIYSKYPEYADKYEAELLHSPEYIYDIAELICNEQEAGQ